MSQLGRRGEPTTKRHPKNNEHARWPLNSNKGRTTFSSKGYRARRRNASPHSGPLASASEPKASTTVDTRVALASKTLVAFPHIRARTRVTVRERKAERHMGKNHVGPLSLTVTLRLTATQVHLRNKYTVLLGPLQSGRYTEHRANTDVTGIVTPRTPHPTCERPTSQLPVSGRGQEKASPTFGPTRMRTRQRDYTFPSSDGFFYLPGNPGRAGTGPATARPQHRTRSRVLERSLWLRRRAAAATSACYTRLATVPVAIVPAVPSSGCFDPRDRQGEAVRRQKSLQLDEIGTVLKGKGSSLWAKP